MINKYIENKFIPTDENYQHICAIHPDGICTEVVIDEVMGYENHIKDYIYVDHNKINSWEHDDMHEIYDIEEYYENIVPVIVEKDGESYKGYKLVYDGNHRVNTLKSLNLNIPAYEINNEIGDRIPRGSQK